MLVRIIEGIFPFPLLQPKVITFGFQKERKKEKRELTLEDRRQKCHESPFKSTLFVLHIACNMSASRVLPSSWAVSHRLGSLESVKVRHR